MALFISPESTICTQNMNAVVRLEILNDSDISMLLLPTQILLLTSHAETNKVNPSQAKQ
jgi:hypothetical protein